MPSCVKAMMTTLMLLMLILLLLMISNADGNDDYKSNSDDGAMALLAVRKQGLTRSHDLQRTILKEVFQAQECHVIMISVFLNGCF